MTDPIVVRDLLMRLVRAELTTPLSDETLLSATFSELGLDSERLIILSGALSDTLDVDVDPVSLFEFSTITTMAAHVATLHPLGSR